MVDVASEKGLLAAVVAMAHTMQAIKQARWPTDSPLLTLPHVTAPMAARVRHRGQVCVGRTTHATTIAGTR
jgi:hypothetical protein